MRKILALMLLCALLGGLLTPALAADFTVSAPDAAALPAFSPTEESGRYMPRETATVMVTATEEEQAWFFSTLSKPVMNRCCLTMKGQVTFTLLRDMTLCADLENTLYVPTFDHNWLCGDAGTTPVPVFDLGGHTLTFVGTGNLLFLRRVGAVVKNGTVVMKSENPDGQILKIGLENGPVATDDGVTPFKTKLILENVRLYNFTGAVLETNVWGVDVKIRDSLLYSAADNAVSLRHSTQSTAKTAYTGEGDIAEVTVENSVLISAAGRGLHIEPNAEYAVTVKDSLLLGKDPSPKFDEHTDKSGFAAKVGSAEVIGAAQCYGKPPVLTDSWAAPVLPPKEHDAPMGIYPEITEAGQIPAQSYSNIGFGGFTHGEQTELLCGHMLTDGSAVSVENPDGIGVRIAAEPREKASLSPTAVYLLAAVCAAAAAAIVAIILLKPRKKEGR